MRRSPVGTKKRNGSLATRLLKLSANRSPSWSRRIAKMKSCKLWNGSTRASASFSTRRYTAERTAPRSTFRWPFRPSKMRAGMLSARRRLRVTLRSAFAPIADAPPSTPLPTCSLVPGRWLKCRHVWHEPAERVKKFADLSFLITLPEGQGLPGRVWNSKKPTWVYDVARDSNFPRAPYAAEAGLRGGFAFPLLFRGEINSIMELFSHNVVEPDEDFLQMVEAFGSQIGLFIERGRIELELQHERENAGAANAARDRFLGMLSHELCAPLNPVLTWAGRTVEQPDLRPEVQQGLKMIRGNVELEIRLIEDMLDLTRAARGKLKLQLRKADAHELLQSAMEIVRSNIQDRHLKLSVALLASHYELVADPPRLEQVFWNVCRNACKFTPENGAVSVRSYNPNPRTITIEISDNGIGIEPQFVGRVFAAFERADSRSEGLGLGLAISKAIVEMHAGTIRARSEGRGKGTTFVIELPVRGSSR